MGINIQASFRVDPKEVKDNLAALSRLIGRFSKKSILDIRVLHQAIEMSVKGLSKRIATRTEGTADICVPLSLFKTFLPANNAGFVKFLFRPGQISCGSSIYSSSAIEVRPVFSNTENVIPTNLKDIKVLRYWLNKSKFELEDAGLTREIALVKRTINSNILEALQFLEQYAVEYEDLETLVMNRILKGKS